MADRPIVVIYRVIPPVSDQKSAFADANDYGLIAPIIATKELRGWEILSDNRLDPKVRRDLATR
jgi:hypothetical protein